jgi:HEAT repeat protein
MSGDMLLGRRSEACAKLGEPSVSRAGAEPALTTAALLSDLDSLKASILPAWPFPWTQSCEPEKLISVCKKYGDTSVAMLLEIVQDCGLSAQQRALALAAIGCLDHPLEQTLPTILDSLSTSDPEIRWMAVHTLRKLGPKASVALPDLIARLGDSNQVVAVDTIYALGKTKDVRAIEPIAPFLSSECMFTRRIAVQAMGEFGSAASAHLGKIQMIAESDDCPYVRIVAGGVIRLIGKDNN